MPTADSPQDSTVVVRTGRHIRHHYRDISERGGPLVVLSAGPLSTKRRLTVPSGSGCAPLPWQSTVVRT